jgi:hypothetical protein
VERLLTRRATSMAFDPREAVEEVRAAVAQPAMRAVLFFCSPAYDLEELGRALRRAFPCPVVGCTSAGQIGPGGYQRGGLTAASLASDELTVHPYLIAPLSQCRERAAEVAAQVRARVRDLSGRRRAFGLVLIDGLSLAEEALAATLYQSIGNLPIVGGSAGDDLRFERTQVYWDGRFQSDAAVFAVFETSLRFCTFKMHHFRPTDRKLVTTAVLPAARVVHEMNGVPAADAYAEALGIAVEELDPKTFSLNPAMLNIGSEYYIRSIQKVNPDRGLTFYCAIDEGLVLTLGQDAEPVARLEQGLREVVAKVGAPSLVIGLDCILRRLHFEQRKVDARIGEILSAHEVIGFSTYGEQFNAVHVNQTFTGIALAG